MNPTQKLELFQLLVSVGFKEIEVGFPAASQADFDFVRAIIEGHHIPEDVTIQVLTQSRKPLIERSFEALRGAKQAIVHLYNSTSTVQRDEVFKKSRSEVKAIAVQGAKWVKECAQRQQETEFYFQYSPESFTGTEMEYAADVVNAVVDAWQASKERPVIVNLPATVEVNSPNVYADQIEWMCENIRNREFVRVSLHTHNDRGCGVAAAELGVLAGADRVEGTLLGNGERTGNMDVVTMAMNLYSQGIDPRLDLSEMDRIISVVEKVTQLPVHPRHAYAGELVFAAFSGSHQDAINKCLTLDEERRAKDPDSPWHVAYLPIDPRDLGRRYQEVIRINSQSGKGGVAFVLEQTHGVKAPRFLQVDFSPHVQVAAESSGAVVGAAEIYRCFQETYFEGTPRVVSYELSRIEENDHLKVTLQDASRRFFEVRGVGKGVLDAFVSGVSDLGGQSLVLVDYCEHSLGNTRKAEAMAYVEMSVDGNRAAGAARSGDIIKASMEAVMSAVRRARGASRAA